MEKAIKYFTENIITVSKTATMFSLDRKKLSIELKNRNIIINKYSLEKFISISNSIHNNKYDYSLSKPFKKVKNKVLIICPIHGKFNQDVYSHKKGIGCPKCGDINTSISKIDTKETFIKKAIKIHENLYDYSNINYVDTNKAIQIECKTHGIFNQSPNKHLQGRGCPICCNEKKGWSKSVWKKIMKKDSLATFYIIRCYNSNEDFIKIGRTINTVKKRYSSKFEMPYNYEVLQEIKNANSDIIFDLEIQYKRLLKDFKYKPLIYFGGITECYNINVKNKIICLDLTNQD